MLKQPNKQLNSQALNRILLDWPNWPMLSNFAQNACEFILLDKGLTNENWLVTLPAASDSSIINSSHSQKFVIRINASNAADLNINRQAEWLIQGLLSQTSITTAYSYREANDRYWIRPYIQGDTLAKHLTDTEDFFTDKKLAVFSRYLHAIHSTTISNTMPTIIYRERTEHYWQQVFNANPKISKKQTSNLKQLKKQLDIKLNDIAHAITLCHMDTNIHNWIISQDHIELIDWEYAALGNPAWDLAVFTQSAQLSSRQTEELLTHYKGINKQELHYAQQQMQYLSTLWFAVQQHITHNELASQLLAICKDDHSPEPPQPINQ